MLALSSITPVVNLPPAVLDGHISYGQSWRANEFQNFAIFGLNPNGALAFLVTSIGTPTFAPGPMPASVGVALTGLPVGTTNYIGTDTFLIGRCAILAQQLLRLRDGAAAPTILEFCTAFPGSTWNSGLGGGLAPGSVFSASISGTTLTVDSVTSGYISGGQIIVATGVNAATRIYANLTGVDGGVGTYQLNVMLTTLSAQFTGTSPAASFTASCAYGTLTVTAIASGSLAVNQVISGGATPAGTIVQQQLSGTPGGLGTYLLALPQTVTSRSMLGNGTSWNNMVAILNKAKTGSGVFPEVGFSNLLISSVGYTQGGSVNDTLAGKLNDLNDMTVQFDNLNLNPTPLKFYYGLPAAITSATVFDQSVWGTYVFCRTNAPEMGGTYSGRVYTSSPSYPWQFNGADQIHTGDYGTSRWGEVEGYARWLVQDKGVQWTPLWRPLTGGAITLSGQVLTVPFARPTSPDFANAPMVWQNNPVDGIKDWPQMGFHVKRGGVDLTVTPTIVGMTVQLAVTETINPGDSLEVSYAWYGPGGPTPGFNSGVGGNLVMNGPPSVLYPNGWNGVAKTIDCWAWPFIETVTV